MYLDLNSISAHSHWAHGFMAAYALWAGLAVLAVLTILAWLWARQRSWLDGVVMALLTGLSAVIALGLNHLVSQAVARVRPCHALTHGRTLTVILSCAHDYSFPSDHSVIAGALATGLLIFDRRLGAVAWILALFLAFARVYAGVHYPGDVIAGLALGALIALVLWAVLRRPAVAVAARLARTPLRPLIVAGVPNRV
jgi:undecaprenyl-diphosphatase